MADAPEVWGITTWDDSRGEQYDTASIEVAVSSAQCSRSLRWPWSQRNTKTKEAVGYPYKSEDGVHMRRHLPEYIDSWKDDNSDPFLVCVGCRQRGVGDAAVAYGPLGTRPTYDYQDVWLDLVYASPDYDVRTYETITSLYPAEPAPELYRYVTKSNEPGGQFLTTPRGMWIIDGSGAAFGGTSADDQQYPGAVGFYEGSGILTYVWHDVPAWAWNPSRAYGMRGKCNDGDFDQEFGPFPAETLMLLNVTPRRKRNFVVGWLYEITFTFLHKPSNVNKIFWWNTYYYLRRNGSTTGDAAARPIRQDTFTNLFLP